jgi:hypothetical protein
MIKKALFCAALLTAALASPVLAQTPGDIVAKLRDMNFENEKSGRLADALLRGPQAYAQEQLRQKTQEILKGTLPGYDAPPLPGMPALPGAHQAQVRTWTERGRLVCRNEPAYTFSSGANPVVRRCYIVGGK